jgi:hypothetical protein
MNSEFSLPPDARARQRMLDQKNSEEMSEMDRASTSRPAVGVAEKTPTRKSEDEPASYDE